MRIACTFARTAVSRPSLREYLLIRDTGFVLTLIQATQASEVLLPELQDEDEDCADPHSVRGEIALPRVDEHEHCAAHVHGSFWCIGPCLDELQNGETRIYILAHESSTQKAACCSFPATFTPSSSTFGVTVVNMVRARFMTSALVRMILHY